MNQSIKTILSEYASAPKLWQEMRRSNRAMKDDDYIVLPYGKNKAQYSTIFFPPQGIVRKKQLFFYIHGGAWKYFTPKQFSFIGKHMASLGYVTVMPGYRKVPKYRYPICYEDVQLAIQTTLIHLTKYGIDAKHVILSGSSAGGHLAALSGMHFSDIAAKHDFHLDGVCSISGVINFACCDYFIMQSMFAKLFTKKYNRALADPYCHLAGKESFAFLALHGSEDPTVHLTNSITFVEQFNQLNGGGASIFVQTEPPNRHMDLIVEMYTKKTACYDYLINWLQKLE